MQNGAQIDITAEERLEDAVEGLCNQYNGSKIFETPQRFGYIATTLMHQRDDFDITDFAEHLYTGN